MANLQIDCIDEAGPNANHWSSRLSSNGHVFFRRTVHVARPFSSPPPLRTTEQEQTLVLFVGKLGFACDVVSNINPLSWSLSANVALQSLASRRAATELKKSIRFIALPFVDTVGLIKQPLDFFFRKRARKVRDFQELVQAVSRFLYLSLSVKRCRCCSRYAMASWVRAWCCITPIKSLIALSARSSSRTAFL